MSCKISNCLGPMEDFHTYIHTIHWIEDFYFPIIFPCEFYEIRKKIRQNFQKFVKISKSRIDVKCLNRNNIPYFGYVEGLEERLN